MLTLNEKISPSIRLSRVLPALVWLVAMPATAAPAWLIATPDKTARAGATMVLDVVKPAAQADWPTTPRLRMVRDGRMLKVALTAVGPVSAEGARRPHRGVLSASVPGLVQVDLAGAESNRLILVIAAADPIERMHAPTASCTSICSRDTVKVCSTTTSSGAPR